MRRMEVNTTYTLRFVDLFFAREPASVIIWAGPESCLAPREVARSDSFRLFMECIARAAAHILDCI
jgi:hypothetical protein